MMTKQRCLNEHISLLQLGAERIKNQLIESSNTLICDMIKNDDIMLIEMSCIDNDNNYDTTNTIDKSYDEIRPSIDSNTCTKRSSRKPSNDQLVLFNNDTNAAMICLPNNNDNALVLVNNTGNIINDPDIKQQFALTIHKIDTDIINLNKDTGLEIAKAIKEYNQSIDESYRHLDEEWVSYANIYISPILLLILISIIIEKISRNS